MLTEAERARYAQLAGEFFRLHTLALRGHPTPARPGSPWNVQEIEMTRCDAAELEYLRGLRRQLIDARAVIADTSDRQPQIPGRTNR